MPKLFDDIDEESLKPYLTKPVPAYSPPVKKEPIGFVKGNLQKAWGNFGQMAGGGLGLVGDLLGSESIKDYGLGAAEGAQMYNADVNSQMTTPETNLVDTYNREGLLEAAKQAPQFIAEQAIQNAPLMLGTGGLGGLVGRSAAKGYIAKQLAETGLKKAIAPEVLSAATRRGIASQLATSGGLWSGLESGSIYADQEEKDPLKALVFGTLAGMIEPLPEASAMVRSGLARKLLGTAEKRALPTGIIDVLKQTGKEALIAAPKEGFQEAVQTGLEQKGRGVDPFSSEARSEQLLSALAGAGLGAGFGGATTLASRTADLMAVDKKKSEDIGKGIQSKSILNDAATLEEEKRSNEDENKKNGMAQTAMFDPALLNDSTIATPNNSPSAISLGDRVADDSDSVNTEFTEPMKKIADRLGLEPLDFYNAASTIHSTSKDYTDFVSKMTDAFGEKAKPYAKYQWDFFQNLSPAQNKPVSGSFIPDPIDTYTPDNKNASTASVDASNSIDELQSYIDELRKSEPIMTAGDSLPDNNGKFDRTRGSGLSKEWLDWNNKITEAVNKLIDLNRKLSPVERYEMDSIADEVAPVDKNEDELDALRAQRFNEIERLKYDEDSNYQEPDALQSFGTDETPEYEDDTPVRPSTGSRPIESNIDYMQERSADYPDHPASDGRTQRVIDQALDKANDLSDTRIQNDISQNGLEPTIEKLIDKQRRNSKMYLSNDISQELEGMNEVLSEKEERDVGTKKIWDSQNKKFVNATDALLNAKSHVKNELERIFNKLSDYYDLKSVVNNLKKEERIKSLSSLARVPDYLISLENEIDSIGNKTDYVHPDFDYQQKQSMSFAKDLMKDQNPVGIKKNVNLSAAILKDPSRASKALTPIYQVMYDENLPVKDIPTSTIKKHLRETYGDLVNKATPSFLRNLLQMEINGAIPLTEQISEQVSAEEVNKANNMEERRKEIDRAIAANNIVKKGVPKESQTVVTKPHTVPTRQETLEKYKVPIVAIKAAKPVLTKIVNALTSGLNDSVKTLNRDAIANEIRKSEGIYQYKLTPQEAREVVNLVMKNFEYDLGEQNDVDKFTRDYRNAYGLSERIENKEGAMHPVEFEPIDERQTFNEKGEIIRENRVYDTDSATGKPVQKLSAAEEVYPVAITTVDKNGNKKTINFNLTKDRLRNKLENYKAKNIEASYKFTGPPKRALTYNPFISEKQLKRMQNRIEELGLVENNEKVYTEDDGKITVNWPMYIKYGAKLIERGIRSEYPRLLKQENNIHPVDYTKKEKQDNAFGSFDEYAKHIESTVKPWEPKERESSSRKPVKSPEINQPKRDVTTKELMPADEIPIKRISELASKPATTTQQEKYDPFVPDTQSSSPVYQTGKFRNGLMQSVFGKIANAFGADLIVVGEPLANTDGMYLPKGRDGRPKIVVNARSSRSLTLVFAHELFHHITNKLSPEAYEQLNNAISKAVNADIYNQKITALGVSRPSRYNERVKEEVNANLFAHVIRKKEFWTELIKTDEGKSLAKTLFLHIGEKLAQITEIIANVKPGTFENYKDNLEMDKLVREWYGRDGIYAVFGKAMVDAYNSDTIRDTDIKYFTDAKIAATEIQKSANKGIGFFAKLFRSIFPKGTKSYKEVMTNIEKLVENTKRWIINHKPSGIYADLGAQPIDVYLASKVAFDSNYEVFKAQQKTEKYEDVWKGMSDIELELLHDKVIRSNLPLDKIDGLTDKQREAFEAYREISDSLFKRLHNIFPDLPKRVSHYGQSIRWFRDNGIPIADELNSVLYDDSKLLSDDRFLKFKSTESTREIANRYNLVYEAINPHRLFLNYVRDASKLINLYEMLTEALVEERAKIFPDVTSASRNGFYPVSDSAMKLMEDMAVIKSYGINYKGQPIVNDYSLEPLIFKTKKEAEDYLASSKLAGEIVHNVDKISVETGRYYFRKDLANMLETLVARDNLRNGELFGISGHQVMNLKNKMTAIEMAMSMFHAMTISHEYNSSMLANNLQNPKGNKWIDAIKGENLFKNIKEARRTVRLLDELSKETDSKRSGEIKNELKELLRTQNDDVVDAVEFYYRAGGEKGMDIGLRSDVHSKAKMKYGSWDEIKGSIKEVFDKEVQNNPDKRLKAYWSAFEYSLLEAPTAWLMEDGIPMLKQALFSREFLFELEKKEKELGRKADDQEKFQVAREVMQFVEDRMGEVNWTGQFMLPTVKTALQFAFRSFTWVSGNIIALSKSASAFTEYGWKKLKGEDAKLSPYGYWGLAAIVNHFLVVGLISAIYSLVNIGRDEAPDDPNTPFITKVLFPRIDRLNPEKRISIPTYVTESYKILSHLGLIAGQKAEPDKLITGRFNSLVSNIYDVLRNENWSGVSIRNSKDNVVKQAIDVAAHLAVLPISVSSTRRFYQDTGEIAVPVMVGLMGMTDAPSSAKRSAATNEAYVLRRKEYKGKEISKNEKLEKDELKRAMYAYSRGDSSKLQRLLQEGSISSHQYKIALTKIPLVNGKPNPLYKDKLSQALGGLTMESALDVWEKMNPNEKAKHRPEIFKKYANVMSRKDKSPDEKREIAKRMRELNLIR